ncbi:anti-sigma factor [Rhodoferax koreense]|uniref:Anti-sigma factor n=1 Tax=Rhodoferax koreensis TaxID=1842727 RepID=A0A1P8JSP6_9BURK|nr:anti-sigma factor [Rhodoferax koreense]APW36741.1 anti-sigma factor [Rhodoferax koreense]
MDRPGSPPNAVAQDDLHRLVDGRCNAAEAAAIEARLIDDPAAAATRAAWQSQRGLLRGLYPQLRSEPVPQTLLDAVQRAQAARRQVDQWWRWGGLAAGVLLAFGLGWFSRGLAPAAARPGQVLVQAGGAGRFAHQAVVAHAVYAPEVRHPVEVAAAQQEHLVQWLSKRLGRPLKLPQLSAQGYELVGGRLLPGDTGARAQFMYQNAANERITLYLGAINTPGSAAPSAMAKETAFSFVSDGPVPGFYWVDQGFGYALAGPLPREALLQLAQTVYQQLEPASAVAK